MSVLIAMPWNEKAKDQANITIEGLRNLNAICEYDIMIADDSKDICAIDSITKYLSQYQIHHISNKPRETIEERLVYARNKLREEFLKGTWTHIFWYESDIVPPVGTIERLQKSCKHNITAIRPQHGNIPGVFPFRGDLPKDLYVTHKLPNFTTTNWEWLCPSRIDEVSCYGTGCNLVSREATEKAEFWCKPRSPATHDILYCMDLQVLGYPTYCDTGLLCAHHYKPLKRPDERFDTGGDWSDLEKYRNHTIQWREKDGA